MGWNGWEAQQQGSGSETLAFARSWGKEVVRQDVVMRMCRDRFLPSPTAGKWFPLGLLLWSLQ